MEILQVVTTQVALEFAPAEVCCCGIFSKEEPVYSVVDRRYVARIRQSLDNTVRMICSCTLPLAQKELLILADGATAIVAPIILYIANG